MRYAAHVLFLATALSLLAASPAAQAGEGVVTATDCATCHDEVVPAFRRGPHGRAMEAAAPGTVERACVACHGPAAEHLEDPSADTIRRVPPPEACLSCHPAAQADMARSLPGHDRAGLVCLDCHAPGHGETAAEPLLRRPPAALCGGCHGGELAASRMPFAHRDGVEPFPCTACHTVHGGTAQGRRLEARAGGACVTCHSEKAGPFVFPHPPREVDGCVTCHQPHGSPNPRLLRRRTVTSLCLECHAGIPAFHDLTQARYRACQTCHAAVHGSNRDPRLIDE